MSIKLIADRFASKLRIVKLATLSKEDALFNIQGFAKYHGKKGDSGHPIPPGKSSGYDRPNISAQELLKALQSNYNYIHNNKYQPGDKDTFLNRTIGLTVKTPAIRLLTKIINKEKINKNEEGWAVKDVQLHYLPY